jgi:hypothetical protein
MHLDVQRLRNFYYRSALGRAAQASLRSAMQQIWPESKGQTVAGFGFAVPLLRPYMAEARRVIALMPGPQGVMAWPPGAPNVSVLVEETLWPIETGHVDKLVLLHGLETSDRPDRLLEECWRVLGPGGRALFIVPNRAGFWSRSDATPFGYGRPYTLGQLDAQLKARDFVIEQHGAALYQMPSPKRFWRKSAPLFEQIGRRLPTVLAGGAFLVEVAKRPQPKSGGSARVARKAAVPAKGFAEPAIRGGVPRVGSGPDMC